MPDGDEVVEVALPAVVTITNELGEPRFPTAKDKIKARKVKPQVVSPADLGVGDLTPRIQMIKQFVPTVQGNCEMIDGATPAEKADKLVARLREESLLSS